MKKIIFIGLWVLLSPVWAKQPVRVVDALGREVVISKQPKRIVTIFSSNTELIASLGLSNQIVGIDAYTYYPPEIKNKPKVGGRLGFSLDKIIAQNPDLVVMTPSRQATHQLLPPLEKLAVPTIVLEANSIEQIIKNITILATATGKEAEGKRLVANIRTRLNKAINKPTSFKAPRVVMITGRVGNGMLLVTRKNTTKTNGYTADIIIHAGGKLALDENVSKGPRLSQISPEVLFSTNPDILLFAGSQKDLDELSSLPGWDKMKASKTGFVRIVSRSELLIPGPRVIDGVENLAKIFEQWSKKQ